jgi:hypothetical protein
MYGNEDCHPVRHHEPDGVLRKEGEPWGETLSQVKNAKKR